MILLVLLGCGLFLSRVIFISAPASQLSLFLLFFATGLLFHYRAFGVYLAFTFLFPFLPSQLFDVVVFDYLEFVFLCFAFWWAFEKIRKRNIRLPSHSINPLLGLFLLILSISAFLAILRHHYVFSEIFLTRLRDNWNIFLPENVSSHLEPLRALLRILEGALFFYITIDFVNTPERVTSVARVIFWAAGMVSLLGILQYLFRFQLIQFWMLENPNIVRINSTFSDPNSLGTYLASMFCFGLFAYVHNLRQSRKLDAAALLAQFVALILTGSRSAMGSVFAAILILPMIGRAFKFDVSQMLTGALSWVVRYGIYLFLFTVTIIVLIAYSVNYHNPQPSSLVDVVLYTFNPRLALSAVLKGRPDIWGAAFRMLAQSPLFGVGLGTFADRILHAPFFLAKPENAHNYFLQILAEGGPFALIAFIALIIQILRAGIVRLKFKKEFFVTYGLISAFITFLLTSLTGHPLLLLKMQFVFWGLGGILVTSSSAPAKTKLCTILFVAVVVLGIIQARFVIGSRHIAEYENGYYSWEKDEKEIPCRWTGPEASTVLEVRGKVLELQMRQLNPDLVKKPYFVRIYVNDQLLDLVGLTDSSWKESKYYLPGVKGGDLIHLRVVPEKTFVPRKFTDDTRTLGIQMRQFAWNCSPHGQPIGVYEIEREGPKHYYWTQGQASFPLDFSVSKVSLSLMPNLSALNKPVLAQIFWNDTLMKTILLDRLQWTNVDLDIPPTEPSGVVTIHVNPIANLKRMGLGEDARELGVRVALPFRLQRRDQTPATGPFLIHPDFYAFSSVKNWPFRIVTASLPKVPGDFALIRNGLTIPRQPGWIESVQSSGKWIQIFKIQNDIIEGEIPAEKRRWPVNFEAGHYLLRMKAKGNLEAGEFPIARIALDEREIARHPILSNEWTDYYFSLDLKQPGKLLSIELANDFYDPAHNIDRNMFVEDLAVSRKQQKMPLLKPGWELSGNTLVIAEPVNDEDFFAPQNDCYKLKREGSHQN